ncbi:hypothetical protein ACFL54_00695 [Planctomycetota bacterium]
MSETTIRNLIDQFLEGEINQEELFVRTRQEGFDSSADLQRIEDAIRLGEDITESLRLTKHAPDSKRNLKTELFARLEQSEKKPAMSVVSYYFMAIAAVALAAVLILNYTENNFKKADNDGTRLGADDVLDDEKYDHPVPVFLPILAADEISAYTKLSTTTFPRVRDSLMTMDEFAGILSGASSLKIGVHPDCGGQKIRIKENVFLPRNVKYRRSCAEIMADIPGLNKDFRNGSFVLSLGQVYFVKDRNKPYPVFYPISDRIEDQPEGFRDSYWKIVSPAEIADIMEDFTGGGSWDEIPGVSIEGRGDWNAINREGWAAKLPSTNGISMQVEGAPDFSLEDIHGPGMIVMQVEKTHQEIHEMLYFFGVSPKSFRLSEDFVQPLQKNMNLRFSFTTRDSSREVLRRLAEGLKFAIYLPAGSLPYPKDFKSFAVKDCSGWELLIEFCERMNLAFNLFSMGPHPAITLRPYQQNTREPLLMVYNLKELTGKYNEDDCQFSIDEIAEIIEVFTGGCSWEEVEGASMEVRHPRLLVKQSWQVHVEIMDLICALHTTLPGQASRLIPSGNLWVRVYNPGQIGMGPDELVDEITSSFGGDSWDEMEGVAIYVTPQHVIVIQQKEVHREIEKYLKQLNQLK